MFDAISGTAVSSGIAGDGLMAIFDAPLPLPDHCQRSGCRAGDDRAGGAVQSRQSRRGQARSGLVSTGPRRHGSWLHGDEQRATYTCIGDTVNLAARLKTHTKVAGQAILIDDATRTGLDVPIAVDARSASAHSRQGAPVEAFAGCASGRNTEPGRVRVHA
jgi:class 3 adenylate cyclase